MLVGPVASALAFQSGRTPLAFRRPNRPRPIGVFARLIISLALTVGLALGLQAAPAEASQKSRVKALISKIAKSSNPRKTYSKLSRKDKALVKKELKSGKATVRVISRPVSTTSTGPVPNAPSNGVCWQMTLLAEYHGGVTRAVMFSTTNTTRVCASGGAAYSVTIPDAYQNTEKLGWHSEGVTDATLDVDWEGRGVVRGQFDFGGGGWVLLSRKLCAQLRLNADIVHYATSAGCSVGA